MKNAGADSNLMTNGCRGRHAVHGLSVETEWLNLLVSHCFSMIMMPYGGPEVQLVDPEHLSPFGHKSEPWKQLLEHKEIVDP